MKRTGFFSYELPPQKKNKEEERRTQEPGALLLYTTIVKAEINEERRKNIDADTVFMETVPPLLFLQQWGSEKIVNINLPYIGLIFGYLEPSLGIQLATGPERYDWY